MSNPASPSFKGKVIAITGGASGIGLAVAKLLSSLGAELSLGDLSKDSLEKAAQEIKSAGGEVFTKTVDRFGRLDGAANMAGVIGKNHGKMMVAVYDEEEWDFVIDVNLKGVMHSMRAELKYLSEKGSIVNAASICGLIGMTGAGAYCASKHGVIGLSRAAAKEDGDKQFRINCVAPGAIATPMLKQSSTQNGKELGLDHTVAKRRADPLEVANLVVFLLSENASFITGAVYSVDGGWNC